MEHWKRLIPGVAGASLALGSEACGGSNGGGSVSPTVIAQKQCAYLEACDSYFAYATVDACVQAYVSDFNAVTAPDLRTMGGSGCVDAYTVAMDCYANLYNAQTCVEPSKSAILAACQPKIDAMLAACANPNGRGAQLTSIITLMCQSLETCAPEAFALQFASQNECVTFTKLGMFMDFGTSSAACQGGALAYHQCMEDAYAPPACSASEASYACQTEYNSANAACGGNIPLTGGSANKSRAPGEGHRPRWLRAAR